MSGGADFRRVKGNQFVALFHPVPGLDKGPEAVAVHVHRVQADVEQNLRAVVQQYAAGVVDVLADHGDLAVRRGHQDAVRGLNGDAVPQRFLGKYLVGHIGNGHDPAGEIGAQFYFAGVVEHKAHPGDAVGNRRDVLLAAHQLQQLYGVLLILTRFLYLPVFCLNKLWLCYSVLV